MQLVFRYPVTVPRCQFCFFILYNTKDRSSVSIYPDNLKIEGNTILFSRRRMASPLRALLFLGDDEMDTPVCSRTNLVGDSG